MKETEFDLAVCLIVQTDKTIETISQIIGTEPSGSIRKGEARFAFQPKADSNIWALRKRYKNQSDISIGIQDFFESTPGLFNKISEVKHCGICTLRLSIVSIWGQIAFSLTPTDLRLLNKLDIPFEVSIFSWGNCIDDQMCQGDGSPDTQTCMCQENRPHDTFVSPLEEDRND